MQDLRARFPKEVSCVLARFLYKIPIKGEETSLLEISTRRISVREFKVRFLSKLSIKNPEQIAALLTKSLYKISISEFSWSNHCTRSLYKCSVGKTSVGDLLARSFEHESSYEVFWQDLCTSLGSLLARFRYQQSTCTRGI